jgi:hypothetical protein
LYLIEQPGILNRDHGLVGEGLHQLDDTRCKSAGLATRQAERSLNTLFAEQGHAE